MTKSTNLKDLLAGAQLPALPQSAIRLLELSQNPNNGPADFSVPIEGDPGLAGQVLRFVNSSYFGFAREISSVKLAITLVGIRTVKNFALWSAVFSLMPNPRCGPFDLRNLWVDSFRRGLFARAIAKAIGCQEVEEVFAASLLQDMAIPLLAKELPEHYVRMLTDRSEGSRRLCDVEQAEFGWNHATAGAMIARSWSLPESFAVHIENHIQCDELLKKSNADKGSLAVSLSSLLPSATDQFWPESGKLAAAYARVCGPKAMPLPNLLAQIDAEFADIGPILKLPAPKKTLAEYLEPTVAKL